MKGYKNRCTKLMCGNLGAEVADLPSPMNSRPAWNVSPAPRPLPTNDDDNDDVFVLYRLLNDASSQGVGHVLWPFA